MSRSARDWYERGCALVERRLWRTASGCFARAVELEPGHGRAWANWGWCARWLGEWGDADQRLCFAVNLLPSEAQPLSLLGQVCWITGRMDASIEAAERAVSLAPGDPVTRTGYALALMNAGEWEKGWVEYEHRFAYKMPDFLGRPGRLWRGETVGHLFLEAEQGFGDAIFGLRWVNEAASRAERVSLYVHKELYGLVMAAAGLPDNVTVYPMPRIVPSDVEAWCPLLSLPAALDKGGPEDGEAYLARPAEVRMPLDWQTGLCRVGIVWSGSSIHEQASERDASLLDLLPLAEVPGVELHSLQVGPAQAQIDELEAHGLVIDRGPEIGDFLDTARVLTGLDLLVGVDTAAAHLAGAMGVPCWLLVNQGGRDFRWGFDGTATGWYPAHRLFRRGLDERDWTPTVRRVAEALRELTIDHCPVCGALLAAGKCIRCGGEER